MVRWLSGAWSMHSLKIVVVVATLPDIYYDRVSARTAWTGVSKL